MYKKQPPPKKSFSVPPILSASWDHVVFHLRPNAKDSNQANTKGAVQLRLVSALLPAKEVEEGEEEERVEVEVEVECGPGVGVGGGALHVSKKERSVTVLKRRAVCC